MNISQQLKAAQLAFAKETHDPIEALIGIRNVYATCKPIKELVNAIVAAAEMGVIDKDRHLTVVCDIVEILKEQIRLLHASTLIEEIVIDVMDNPQVIEGKQPVIHLSDNGQKYPQRCLPFDSQPIGWCGQPIPWERYNSTVLIEILEESELSTRVIRYKQKSKRVNSSIQAITNNNPLMEYKTVDGDFIGIQSLKPRGGIITFYPLWVNAQGILTLSSVVLKLELSSKDHTGKRVW